ncbi:DNA ligase D [Longimicrobium sp.]|uniref:DNA ligase D n=1 Tax=Longimicrobium sp. TaxID=2029185 RepID=UPI002CF137F0|nr:DNA ligase D [Longimicrobium sp.]HSU18054.1 DNA ligase D [Longimicrobium sp.]
MGLSEYHRKRDFSRTAEPRGHEHESSGPALSFVIQKHAASHLHYDFRLELDGVLKSWAVPKGPTYDPTVKRLAVHVEDHPIEYGDFEGIIPKGEYGGGTVMLWDAGTWEPLEDAHRGYAKGHLKFRLDGQKMHGGWHLVRSRRGEEGEKEQWLLFKDDDELARPESEGKVVEDEALSVKTGRSIEEIATDADATWNSNRPPKKGLFADAVQKAASKVKEKITPAKKPAAKSSRTKKAAESPAPAVPGARRAAMPRELLPELATLVDDVPASGDWLHEIKFDGYRLLAFIDSGKVRMLTRKANDWTDRFPGLVAPLKALPAKQAILDGELVIVAPNGTTSFQMLQNVLNNGRQDELVFYAFDLLYLDGVDLRGVPLSARKEALNALLGGAQTGQLRYSDHISGSGKAFHAQACRMGLEGIICKRADSRYVSKRAKDWLKVKCMRRQEFVIGGWTDPKGSRSAFGSLHLGYYRDGELIHAGKVGTGFDEELLRDVHARLKKRETDESPFSDFGRKRRPKDVHWARPELVCEVAFTEWTDAGTLRHPTFQGLREDKSAREVVREDAVPVAKAARPSPAPPPAAPAKGDYDRPLRNRDLLERPPSTSRSRAKKGAEAEVAGVRITHPDKVLYPDTGVTKLELARYYEEIGEDWMLPYCGGRPLTLVRCPEGAGKPCFYQKHADDNFPKAVGRVEVQENTGDKDVYTYVDSVAGLVSLVQMGVLELHVWGARRDNIERPDLFIIDLDPAADVAWERVVASALWVRGQLGEMGLESWCKTTGGKGLHVVVPIARRHTWDEVKEFTRLFCAELSRRAPGQYITKSTLAKRGGKIFLDYLRNARGATAISAYSVRAKRAGAASVPLAWDEVSAKIRSDQLTPAAVIERMKKLTRDPWEDFYKARQTITKQMKQAVGMKE